MAMTLQQFGQTIKAKYPQYQDLGDEELGQKIISQYPQYSDMVNQSTSLGGVAESGVSDVKNMIKGFTDPNSPLQQLVISPEDITNPIGTSGKKLNALGDIVKGTFNEYVDLAKNPIGHATTHPVNTVLDLLPFIKGLSGLKGASALTPEEAASTAYQATQDAAANAGVVPKAAWENAFGTYSNPNSDLYSGLSNAKGTPALIDELRQEINQQGRANSAATPTKTYAELLEMRRGANAAAKWNSGNPAPVQKLNQNIAKAYSTMLHEGVPESIKSDQLYKALKEAQNNPPTKGPIQKSLSFVIHHPYMSYFAGRGIANLIQSLTTSNQPSPSAQPTNNQFQSGFGTYYQGH